MDFKGMLHFAWDEPAHRDAVVRGIELLKKEGFDTRREISVYVLTNFNTTIEQDYERVQALRDIDVNPFVMVYGKTDKAHHDLARRVNRKSIFWSKTWKEGATI
jgi:hypothetical protein